LLDEEDTNNKKKKTKKSKIVPQLAALTLFHGTHFKTFETSIALDTSHMHSISEPKIAKILGKSGQPAKSWREYNQKHMTRTYPSGVRVDSSNYNPIMAWAVGSQPVALNFQTHDTPLLLNDGRFRQAGSCGYVLKPPSVMGNRTGGIVSPKTVQIKIISGHCLPKPKGSKVGEAIDPYVKVELHDVCVTADGKEEYCSDEGKTNMVKNNGFCPAWPKHTPKVFQVQHPDVGLILFQVLDEDLGVDDKIASAAIPVNALRQGYRSVQLFSGHKLSAPRRSGPFEYASLLVRIDFSEIDEA
jgi:phosphatidylinositol phospholipase C delta